MKMGMAMHSAILSTQVAKGGQPQIQGQHWTLSSKLVWEVTLSRYCLKKTKQNHSEMIKSLHQAERWLSGCRPLLLESDHPSSIPTGERRVQTMSSTGSIKCFKFVTSFLSFIHSRHVYMPGTTSSLVVYIFCFSSGSPNMRIITRFTLLLEYWQYSV